jgi:hypothetical protein
MARSGNDCEGKNRSPKVGILNQQSFMKFGEVEIHSTEEELREKFVVD